jgi:uncharacterized protein with PIN domain
MPETQETDNPIVDAMVESLKKNLCPICDTPLQEIGHTKLLPIIDEWRAGRIVNWESIVGCPKCRSVFWKKKEE